MDESALLAPMGRGHSLQTTPESAAVSRAALHQWQAAGYLLMAVGLLLAVVVALGWSVPSFLLLGLGVFLLPTILAWAACDARSYRFAALSSYAGASCSGLVAVLLPLSALLNPSDSPSTTLLSAMAALVASVLFAAPFAAAAISQVRAGTALWQAAGRARIGREGGSQARRAIAGGESTA